MLKNVFLAVSAFAVVAGAAVLAPATAQATSCQDAAKMTYPDSIVDRVTYRRDCKKAYKASVGKEGPLAKVRSRLSS